MIKIKTAVEVEIGDKGAMMVAIIAVALSVAMLTVALY